jgi:hypothetical protein
MYGYNTPGALVPESLYATSASASGMGNVGVDGKTANSSKIGAVTSPHILDLTRSGLR